MFMTLIVVSIASGSSAGPIKAEGPAAAPRCVLSGKVELKRSGEKVKQVGPVVVYVEKVSATAFRAVSTSHRITQFRRQFDPQVLVVQKKDSVEFYNSDLEPHSVFSRSPESGFDFDKSKLGVTGRKTFTFPGPVRIQCNVHPKMRADVLVLQNPFFAYARPDGAWQIRDLPSWTAEEGEKIVTAWEPNGSVTSHAVKSCAGTTTLPPLALDEAILPPPLDKDGNRYRDYSYD
jgi:plastocyanin